MIAKRIILVLSFHLAAGCLLAQTVPGEIESVEIEIVKEREVTVPRASRDFEEIPARPFEEIQPPLIYEFKRLAFNSPDYKASLRPLRLKVSPPEEVWSSSLAAGLGNFGSVYGEAYLTSKPSKSHRYGLHFLHNSAASGPVDEGNSASGNTGVRLFGTKYGKSLYLNGDASYTGRRTYFYGYQGAAEVDRDTIRQAFETLALNFNTGSVSEGALQYKLGGGFRILSDNYSANESEVKLLLDSRYKATTGEVLLQADYSVAARKDATTEARPRNLFLLRGVYQFEPLDKLTLSLGARVVFENDTLGESKTMHIYPVATARYSISKSVDFHLAVDGVMDKVNLQTLTMINPWLEPDVFLNHSNRLIDLSAKLVLRTSTTSSLTIGASVATIRNFHTFINTSEPSKFTVSYDKGKTGVSTAFAEFAVSPSRGSRLSLLGEYFSYNTDQSAEAWHRPDYRIVASATNNFYDKVGLQVDFTGQGGMLALAPDTQATVTLDPALDLSVKADYRVSKKFSVFVRGNNLLGKEYPLFLYYPVRGVQVLAGASLTF